MSLSEKIINGVAFVIAVFIGVLTLWWIADMIDFEYYSNNPEEYTEKEIDPKLILQERYARGEIGSLEYLERMTRL